MTDFAELHSHLYGCLIPDDLYYLAARNKPRWNIFAESRMKAYGEMPLTEGLMALENRKRLEDYYHFRNASNFPKFQSCFDLVIALSTTEPEELQEIAKRVCEREPARHAEYRMLFSPFIAATDFKERVHALTEAIEQANRAQPDKTFRLAVSLPRQVPRGEELFSLVAELQSAHEAARKQIVAIDFCAQEEGYPPRLAQPLLDRIHAHNKKTPQNALAILYHVGESFTDKSVESAIRWIIEAAESGCHRLGHAIALGAEPEMFRGSVRKEIVTERLDQIDFELENLESLMHAGVELDEGGLVGERRALLEKQSMETIDVFYSDARVRTLRCYQDWAMRRIRVTGAVIESCPTSNMRIGALSEPHPVHRFIAADLPVVIGADDPGIFATDLNREFEILSEWGVMPETVRAMKQRSMNVISEKVSGRK